MSTAEWISPDVDASYERPSEIDARELFANRPDVFAHFYFDFYKEYCRQDATSAPHALLSFGEATHSIIVARQDYSKHPSKPDSYLIKEYDLHTSQIHDWSVTDASVFQGRGDDFERTLLLESPTQPLGETKLHLSSRGNQWIVDEQAELLNSAHLLPSKALYDLRLTESHLADFYQNPAPHRAHSSRKIGKTTLIRVQ